MINSKKKGFTIVELVIVIAVIAVLAAVLIPTFSNLVKKANVSSDTALVKNLNTALAADTNEHNTMGDALAAAKEFGYDITKINAKANGNEILWDSKNDCFVYLDRENSEGLVYIPDTKVEEPEDYELWIIYDEAHPTYSTYLYNCTKTSITTSKGIDTGEYRVDVVYNGTEENIIRTNNGNLTVESGSVIHYGVARYLHLNPNATYTEKGSVVADITNFEQKTEETGWTLVENESELLEALNSNVEKIMLVDDIDVLNDITDGTPNSFVVNSNVEINLNGYNITGVHTNDNDTLNINNVLIKVNNATLTLSGYGIVSLKYEGTNMQWNALSSTLRLEGSNSTININDAVVIEHLGGTPMSYAIDCYASGNENTLNVNGGALNSAYIAIRWFYPNNASTGKININAGILTGKRCDLWIQGSTTDNASIVKIADTYKVSIDGDLYNLD